MKSKIKKAIEKFNYWEAIEILEKEREKGSISGEELFELANLYRGVGEMEKALSIFEEANEKGFNEAERYIKALTRIVENKR